MKKKKYKNWCQLASKFGKEGRKPCKELYIVMGMSNTGYYFETPMHIRKTLAGIIRVANQNYLTKGNKIKILRLDLDKAEVVFEGKHGGIK